MTEQIDMAAGKRKKSKSDARAFVDILDRKIPNSIDAEQGVIACCFLSPHEAMAECVEKLKPGTESFYDLRHQVVYSAMLEMYDEKQAIDVLTVRQRLIDKQQLESVGGIIYLASLPDFAPSAANLSFYIGIVLVKYVLRQMLEHSSDYASKIYEHDGEIDSLLDEFESDALKIRDSVTTRDASDIKSLVHKRIDFYEECDRSGGGLLGVSTGYPDLDRMTNGLKECDLILLAARPSMGKTSLAMNIAENVAIDQNLPVGIFSLEMSSEALVGRMISSRSRVNERNLIRAATNEQEKKNTFVGAIKVGKAPIFIDDTSGLTISQIKAKARRMKQRHKIVLLVIDYIQLLRPSKPKPNRQEEIAEISVGIKSLAKELHIPVIAICQLNREMEKDKERKPRMSDLRESGQLEQDADIIGMLYAQDPVAAASGQEILAVNLLIAKQRNGPVGDVNFTFHRNITRFESAAKFEPTIQRPPKSWIPQELNEHN